MSDNGSSPDLHTLDLLSVVETLQRQLASQPIIEQAKGILMAQSRCDADQAFDMLRRASQRTNTKLREVAAEIVRKTGGAQAVDGPNLQARRVS
jgi:AmiR/NasT family two-component response regulator